MFSWFLSHFASHLLQNTHIDSHKKSSVRHKLVSLTLKKKSKITEEVSDAVTMVILSCLSSLLSTSSLLNSVTLLRHWFHRYEPLPFKYSFLCQQRRLLGVINSPSTNQMWKNQSAINCRHTQKNIINCMKLQPPKVGHWVKKNLDLSIKWTRYYTCYYVS